MKKTSTDFENLKIFCITKLLFYGICLGLYAFAAICWFIQGNVSLQFYEISMMAVGFIYPLGAILSVLWLLITIIWCSVICKREHTTEYFFKPEVIISNVLSILFPIIFLWGIYQ